MGLNASVMCKCYPEGRTTPCPYPEHFTYDPTNRPALDLDYVGNEQAHEEFRRWLESACEHPNMDLSSVFIASWKGYQQFEDTLKAMPDAPFLTLLAQLPDGDDGLTPADEAQRMLTELDRFEALATVGEQAVLVDSERDDDISMGSNVLKGTLTMDRTTGFDLGFDREGFFIRDRWDLNRELFRAMRVEQQLIYPESHQVRFIDRDSDKRFESSTPFGKPITDDEGNPRMYLWQFHIELRPVTPARFAYITGPLREVLQASLETGNPVRWG